MAGREAAGGTTRAGGLLGSIKKALATLVAVADTRLRLLANEIHAESHRVAQLLVLGAASGFFLAFGFVLLTVFVIAMFWDTHRLLAIGGFAALYIVVGIALAAVVRGRAAARTRLFEASLAELAKDRDRLSV